MKRPRLFTTSAVRLALKYSLLYALLLALLLALFLWVTNRSVDTTIVRELETENQALLSIYRQQGLDALLEALNTNSETKRFSYLLRDSQQQRLAGNIRELPDDFEDETGISNLHYDEKHLAPGRLDDDVYLPTLYSRLDNGESLLIVHPAGQAQALQQITEYLLEFAIASIALALLLGLLLGYAILRRIDTITATSARIVKGDITQRIPLSGKNDEFDALSGQLNLMLDRIQALIKGIREVSDNVAHDLRSPLTRLRNNIEITLLEPRSKDEYRKTLQNSIRDIESLLETFNALLSIAQAESGNHRSEWKNVDLNTLLDDIVELYAPVAESANISLHLQQPHQANMTASRDLLTQAFVNLLENALKYTPEFGEITVSIVEQDGSIEISFRDTGPGIPAHERERVLKRFVQLESSRNTPGNGLGLSLVLAVCELHHGKLAMDDAKPGLIVTLSFPSALSAP